MIGKTEKENKKGTSMMRGKMPLALFVLIMFLAAYSNIAASQEEGNNKVHLPMPISADSVRERVSLPRP